MPIRVNNQLLDDKSIRDEARLLRERLHHESPEADLLTLDLRAREWAQENAIMRSLAQQAAGTGSPEDLVATIMAKVPRPKRSEIVAHYHQFAHGFRTPAVTRAAHIVKHIDENATEDQAKAAILDIQQQLKQGADFAQMADLHSDCPGNGGDLGFFPSGEMVAEFDAALASLKPAEISPVFRTPFGFHIAKLLERRPPGMLSLNDVYQQIEHELWSSKKTRAADDFMRNLRSRADIRRS